MELNNPFEQDFDKIMEQIHVYEELLSKHRLVVKVPHTGPVNADNVSQLLNGDTKLDKRYDQGTTADYLHGHNLALKLKNLGYRVNFTLMFEPYQTALALQARPYFVNAFVRQRAGVTKIFQGLLAAYEASGDKAFLQQLRDVMVSKDYLSKGEGSADLFTVKESAENFLYNRDAEGEGSDGLDSARNTLRWLKPPTSTTRA